VHEPGLHDPDGKAIPNYDVMAESSAAPSTSPAIWEVTLPPLDYRAISTIGYTFSVVARDGSGYHDYPFGIRAPRYANELTKCGSAYYSTGVSQGHCLDKGAPPPRPEILRISKATYDGRALTLDVEVPEAGRLLVKVPTTCPKRPASGCHRKTPIHRRASRRGHLTIRKPLALRLGKRGRITLGVRFEMAHSLIVSSVPVKVQRLAGR
jgi:hypothetical protein